VAKKKGKGVAVLIAIGEPSKLLKTIKSRKKKNGKKK
jgi:hypothetical protein|tara:strand:- start:2713 stop:2823 length:111 start_codon:yes stop_codon:yes gene_type:complete